MKKVLIIDESSLIWEYLRTKLEQNRIEVNFGKNPGEGLSIMKDTLPALIVLDYSIDPGGSMELLKQKNENADTKNTPVIILTQYIDQKQLAELAPYNVKEIFTKPVQIDSLFDTLSGVLGINFKLDQSPGIVDAHVNENIIYIEISRGLNNDKLELLHYKIRELSELYKFRFPKVIIMFRDIKLGPSDAGKLSLLLTTVFNASNVKPDNIHLVTDEDYIRVFLDSNKEYSGIMAVPDLQAALESFPSEAENTAIQTDDKLETDARNFGIELTKKLGRKLRIAVIDDIFFFQEFIKAVLQETGATITTFFDGDEFLMALDVMEFDLIFLDLNMPRVDGFEVLKAMQGRKIESPVIALTSINDPDAIIKAIQLGVKSYLIKPVKPHDVFRKTIEILKANF
jgi:DNA-binding response OmpR family regulator